MIVFLSGATGFVGRALCTRLAADGIRVRAALRTSQNDLPAEQVIVPSVGPKADWTEGLVSVETVVHLAAHVHVMKSGAEDERLFHEINIEGTRHLAESAAATGVKRFIFLSTVKVHGERTHGTPFTEEMPLAPEDAYSRSKAEAESVLKRIGQASGMEIVIIRPPLVYGPGVKANFLQLLKFVHRGVPLPLGALHNARSLVYLDNLVDAVVTCIQHHSAANETFLVSDGKDLSTADLVRLTAKAMDVQVFLPPIPTKLLRLGGKLLGKGDMVGRIMDSLQIDSSFVQKKLGWRPPHTIEEGLQKTVQWFLEQQKRSAGR
ncbi:MAG TPA: NAD-dependent epimerase/dehydratase family protein [Dissulfurispiraceae bacterium]|nr:NAD-dependent epimerase/dehydratase family protein [Dissulfurispiraceae bacterium]